MKHGMLFTTLVALALASCLLRAQGHTSTRAGVYSEAQAARGQSSYKAACASCHGASLEGSGAQNPALVGKDFLGNWTGEAIGELFEKIQTSMPADKPGSLSRTTNSDIVAYILKMNKLPSGSKDLPSDAEALKQIQFDTPE